MRACPAGAIAGAHEHDFHIQQLGEKIGSFAKRRLITEAVQIGPVNASGMRVVMRSAYDGGVVFVSEVVD